MILGLFLSIVILFLGKAFQTKAPHFLGLLMIDVALWVLSESTLRQLLFHRPSLSQYFAYFTVELIGALACMYFDEVQHRIHHRSYLVMETLVFVQLVVNILLHASNICPLYRTLILSHIWSGLCIVLALFYLITDLITKRMKDYRITAIGMVCFVIMSFGELAGFYISEFHQFGTFICIGLIFLMAATVIQTLSDAINAFERREKKQESMTIQTIETIAAAIDAKDEYTGGHSERVGFYAERLAREMAADYDLSEEDILRVQYIGLVHDIGKIGVADNILNKSGKLDDEEYSLMKKHSEIGYEIMSSLGEGIEGLLDGIRHHHERFDGKGYPDGHSDTDIPLIARILSLADSYDAMTSNRVYRKRLTDEEVKNELLRCSGTQFDPALTAIFIRLLERGELSASTIDGAAADKSGAVRTSSLLEDALQKDLLAKVPIQSPSHIRMLCYIIKLMEKKGKDYRVIFLETGSAPTLLDSVNDTVKKLLHTHDIHIAYTRERRLIALFDRSAEEAAAFADSIQAALPAASVTVLC